MDVVRDVKTIENGNSPRARYARLGQSPFSFNWQDNLDVQRLLDVVSSIIADEYIEVAKRNREVFGIASVASQSRNDERK